MLRILGKLPLGFAVLCMIAVTACTATYRNHGYVPTEESLSEIIVGVDTRASVEDVIGSPTSAGLLSDSGYYYVKSRVRNFAYRAPQVVEREVLAISFDGDGVVANIERFGLEDGRVVALERRVTESSVADKSFLRQLLGNLGRFGGFSNE